MVEINVKRIVEDNGLTTLYGDGMRMEVPTNCYAHKEDRIELTLSQEKWKQHDHRCLLLEMHGVVLERANGVLLVTNGGLLLELKDNSSFGSHVTKGSQVFTHLSTAERRRSKRNRS